MHKSLSIIGSTGSIGTQALDIVRMRPDDFKIIALSAGNNLQLLIEQIKEFNPEYVSILKDADKKQIKDLFPEVEVLKDIKELASVRSKSGAQVDIVLSAIVGIAGLEANLMALKHAKRTCVANKETLVAAGHIVRDYCEKYNSELIPVDSEHVAIHQCLASSLTAKNFYEDKNLHNSIKEILLTSSGGPFRTWAQSDFKKITKADALKHPNWSMGEKITIDSSTLMNKGLEVIEAHALFGIPYEKIQVVVHPQSIVHSAVTFVDGNTMAQLGSPDMRMPIQYSLDYPHKKQINFNDGFNIFKTQKLEFFEPELEKFPALKLAYEAGQKGHSYPAVLNSANEFAVQLFLEEKIRYTDIVKLIERELEIHKIIENPTLSEILQLHSNIQNNLTNIYV